MSILFLNFRYNITLLQIQPQKKKASRGPLVPKQSRKILTSSLDVCMANTLKVVMQFLLIYFILTHLI